MLLVDTKPATKWTEASLVNALRSRYASNEWALVTQVRDGAGWDRRTFDAIAIGLWGSRGHPVHGFECKVSRGDWKRELAKPEKADPLVAFCDYWWVVAPSGVVDPLTLPEGWGLLVAHDNGTIHTGRESAKREAKPPTMGFIAQMAKRLLAERPAKAEIDAARDAGYQEGLATGRATGESRADMFEDDAKELRRQIDLFEETSGLSLDIKRYASDNRLREYADVVRLVVAAQGTGYDAPIARLRQARQAAGRFLEAVDELLPGEEAAS